MDEDYAFIEKLAQTLEQVLAQIDEGRQQNILLGQHIVQFDRAAASLESMKKTVDFFNANTRNVVAGMNGLSDTLSRYDNATKTHALVFDNAADRAVKAAAALEETTQKKQKQSLIWVGGMVMVVALIIGAISYFEGKSVGAAMGQEAINAREYEDGRVQGFKEGQMSGKKEALDIATAASWANTPNGYRAYLMDKSGDLNSILECSRPGWTKETQPGGNVMCYPRSAKDGLYGWVVR
ncbi:hypothetical protein KSAC_34870 (plasmid) [Komagataeibacter saccharivorans]|uniref:hypothetical protein n=1 Tax=Komagataeibacter saccharivorans TaxID=265959 RepID=UPI001043A981|nr:hypothetical protein [Komagataeibacter saccharivorans]QBL95666.1 hypothetical protein KSAC_34870 [Komagataeibacter saccharivorans]